MQFIEPQHLSREQRDHLAQCTPDERAEFEEEAAGLEYDCGERRPHAECSAYCRIQRVTGCERRGWYPEK
ncbi:MAG TPA: hypothetical protein VEK08_04280 [Planctomycetota bacterium]|nr:hypothetical protein [Planctomycetota bacterium]